uniref:Hydroxylysine kinase n=2 Tax=Lepeophtheirus salmonis TaxID=72036 RepID=A0A0K2T5G2_LEPSM
MNVEVIPTPELPLQMVKDLLLDLYGLKIKDISQLNAYDDRNIRFKIEEIVNNKYLKDIHDPGYVLKVTNNLDSQQPEIYESQNKIMFYLRKQNMNVSEPIANKTGKYISVEKELFPGSIHVVRVLKFIPGMILYSVPNWTTDIFYRMGDYIGEMSKALHNYKDPVLSSRYFMWQLKFIEEIKPKFYAKSLTNDPDKRKMIDSIIDKFVEAKLFKRNLETSIIHGDFNEQNVLLNENNEIYGLIDFGDVHEAPVIFELAIAIMYAMTKSNVIPPNEVGGHILAGYLKHRALTQEERSVLKICVAGRYAQSLVLGAYSHEKYPTNEYLVVTANTGWNNLRAFWEDSKTDETWDHILKSYN